MLPRKQEVFKTEQRVCTHCNDHIAQGNFRCLVRYISTLRGASEFVDANQKFVALRMLAEAMDPTTPWKCDPNVEPAVQRVRDIEVSD